MRMLQGFTGNYGPGYIMDEPEMGNQTWWRVQCFKRLLRRTW